MRSLKQIARDQVAYLERKGIIQKPKLCEWCGKEAYLVKHHPDYGQPVRVVWLCSGCHGAFHNKHRRGLKYQKRTS